MGEKVPAFQFYPRDYLCDPHVRAMTHEQRGLYWDACCFCWLEESLPTDVGELAAILGVPAKRLAAIWPRIAVCFHEVDGRLRHPRLDAERGKQAESKARRAAAAAKRWRTPNADALHQQSTPDADALQCSASASASASATAVCVEPTPQVVGPILRPMRRNVAIPWRVPFPGELWAQCRGRLAAEDHRGDEAAAERALHTWAMGLIADWGDKPTGGDDDFAFWRARFAEWRGTTKRAAASAADPPPPRLPRARDVLAAQGIPLPARKVAP